MTAEVFDSGSYIDPPREKKKDGGFSSRVSVTEGTQEQSRVRTVSAPQMAKPPLARAYNPPSEPLEFEPVMRPKTPPQTSLAPNGDSVDLGLVTKTQHKMLTDRSRNGKKRAK